MEMLKNYKRSFFDKFRFHPVKNDQKFENKNYIPQKHNRPQLHTGAPNTTAVVFSGGTVVN